MVLMGSNSGIKNGFSIDSIKISLLPYMSFSSIFCLTEKFHETCNFLANSCFVEQNLRKETPLKIKFYFVHHHSTYQPFSKAWKCSFR